MSIWGLFCIYQKVWSVLGLPVFGLSSSQSFPFQEYRFLKITDTVLLQDFNHIYDMQVPLRK